MVQSKELHEQLAIVKSNLKSILVFAKHSPGTIFSSVFKVNVPCRISMLLTHLGPLQNTHLFHRCGANKADNEYTNSDHSFRHDLFLKGNKRCGHLRQVLFLHNPSLQMV